MTRETRKADGRHESGRPKHAPTAANMTTVNELLGLGRLGQEDQTQTHRSTRHISTVTGLTQIASYRSFTAMLV